MNRSLRAGLAPAEGVHLMASQVSDRSSSEKLESSTHIERSEVVVGKLVRFYSVMGHRPEEPGALALMAEMLTQSATDEQITSALSRCARECRFPVRIPDIMLRIPGQEVPHLEAEARKAWDVVEDFVSKWVQSDVEGNYMISRGVRSTEPPTLSTRIVDTVRRTGGWRAYKTMNQHDYPYQQKRFFEEYQAWAAVESANLPKLLVESPKLQLIAKSMERMSRKDCPPPTERHVPVNKTPEPLTEAQLRDRREMLRQQAQQVKQDRSGGHGAGTSDIRQ
jgi:hypothetical protein